MSAEYSDSGKNARVVQEMVGIAGNCVTLLTSLTYYFVFLVIVLEMADIEAPKAYCGLAGLGLTQAVPL